MLVFVKTFLVLVSAYSTGQCYPLYEQLQTGDYEQFPLVFPQGQQSERNASARENHPARERRDSAAVRVLSPHRVSPFSREVIFTRARVSLTPLFLRENGDHLQSRTTVAVFVCLFACLFICWQNGGDCLTLQYGITNFFLFSHQKNLLIL